jgi:hypothetical protein
MQEDNIKVVLPSVPTPFLCVRSDGLYQESLFQGDASIQYFLRQVLCAVAYCLLGHSGKTAFGKSG